MTGWWAGRSASRWTPPPGRPASGSGAWRCASALFGLPYGDQGLFVRRAVFERMGGFRPIPLMEDVEFVGRMKREGRILHLKVKIVTSARRWERDGWWRRTRGNLGLLALYYVGVSPERLARRYEKRVLGLGS